MKWLSISAIVLLVVIAITALGRDTYKKDVTNVEVSGEKKADLPESAEPVTTPPKPSNEDSTSSINLKGERLDLSHSGLTSVPQSIFKRTELVSLNLSGNNLTGALPAEVRHLSALQEINLSDNHFTGIPAEVGQLSQLRVLNVAHNAITGLPQEIANLKLLEIFDLRGNSPSSFDLDIIRKALPHTKILTD